MKHAPQMCSLCGSGTNRAIECHGRTFFHCSVCDLVFVPVDQHPDVDASRARYLLHHNDESNREYVRRFERVIEIIRLFSPNARRVLDFGCGPEPVFVRLLQKAGYETIGYDPIFTEELNSSESFDVIASIETIEHFAKPAIEFAKIKALVVAGGLLIMVTQLHRGHDSFPAWWYARDKTHIVFYSEATMKYIALVNGFRLLRREGPDITVFQV